MRKWLIKGLILLQLSFAVASSQSQELYLDPPAIDVFPNHDAVVSGTTPLSVFLADGKRLFRTVFNARDGVGRPEATGDSKPTLRDAPALEFHRIAGPDASSCADCHNVPMIGGSGGMSANVFVGAHFTDPPTNQVSSSITSERNTIGMFGAGAIEMLAFEMTEELQRIKNQALIDAVRQNTEIKVRLVTKQTDFGYLIAYPDGTYDSSGVRGVDADLVIKPFGTKGVGVSLREFTNFALNQHHGIQSEERFGWARTGITDFDHDGIANEFSIGQMSALVLYQASLPAPVRESYTDPAVQQQVRLGEELFRSVGCSDCHVPDMPLRSAWFLEPNPYNRPGSAVPSDVAGQIMLPFDTSPNTGLYRDEEGMVHVAAYTDLKRHVICDAEDPFFCNERRMQDFVPIDQFLTSKLWDVGSSAPYGHRGDLTTIAEVIYHHSGEGRAAKIAFTKLSKAEKQAIIIFLKSLVIKETPSQFVDAPSRAPREGGSAHVLIPTNPN